MDTIRDQLDMDMGDDPPVSEDEWAELKDLGFVGEVELGEYTISDLSDRLRRFRGVFAGDLVQPETEPQSNPALAGGAIPDDSEDRETAISWMLYMDAKKQKDKEV